LALITLPRGRGDLLRQIGIWLGLGLGYEVARALAKGGSPVALGNGRRIVRIEDRFGGLVEFDLRRWALHAGHAFVVAVDWTYWLAQFAVLSAGLLWVYLRRPTAYPRVRNTLLGVNLLGLIGYVAVPTAPHRLLDIDGLGRAFASSRLTFRSGIVGMLANPYAAMPSLRAADALLLAVLVAPLMGRRIFRLAVYCGPVWVCFCVIATGNHFWLDVLAGAALAALGVAAPSLFHAAARSVKRGQAVRAQYHM
jgi:hypothetical protein